MNFTQKIQKVFNTDKWRGRLFLFYFLLIASIKPNFLELIYLIILMESYE